MATLTTRNYNTVAAANKVPKINWENVFITGQLEEKDSKHVGRGTHQAKAWACACALGAWASCAFSTPPENFGKGMLALAQFAELSVSDLLPENATRVANISLQAMGLRPV